MKRVIVLIMMLVFSTTAYAVPFEANPYAHDQNQLEITGNARNSKVTLVIKKNNTEEIIYVDTALSDPKQGFRFILKPSENGLLDINVIADYEATGTEKTISFVSVDVVERIERILKTGSKEEMESLFGEEFTLNYFDIDKSEYVNTQKIGGVLYNLRTGMDDLTSIGDYVPFAAIIVSLDTQADCSDFITETQEKGVELASLPLYEKLSAEGKENVALRISKGNFGMNEVEDVFTDAVIFGGIETSTWNDAVVFFEAAGIGAYNNASKAVREMVQKELSGIAYDDFDAIEADIKKIVKRVAKKTSTTVGGGGSGGGGGSQSIPAVPAVLPEQQFVNTLEEKMVFSDVPQTYWGFEAINHMHWQGIVFGYNDVFEPERKITRAEFAAMLTRVLSFSGSVQAKFLDVTPDDWYYSSVAALYENEIIIGDGELFYPNDQITRQDMAVMIDRIAKKSNHSLKYERQSFDDISLVSEYATEAIDHITGIGLMNGMGNGSFAPQEFATRAEATQIIYQLWKNDIGIK